MNAWADNPQAAEIDALISRAGRLSDDEIKRLEAAREATQLAGRYAAFDAAWAAAFDAAFDAAWDAARAAAWAAAWDAARDAAGRYVAGREAARAARALVVRDLIDENTAWNQAAYDLLTGPWRRVIGSIHPADEVLA